MATPARIAPQHLKPLTSLRLFAAGMIVLHHMRGQWGIPSDVLGLSLGQGVTFFFVLSGFILTYVYNDIHEKSGVKKFLIARASRLYPIHFATLAIALVFVFIGESGVTPIKLFTNAFLIQTWWPDNSFALSLNAVSWSIANEIFFYICFPLLIFFINRIFIIFIIYISIVILFLNAGVELVGQDNFDFFVHFSPVIRLLEFIFGMLLGRIFLAHSQIRLSNGAGTLVELTALAVLAACMLHTHWIAGQFRPVLGDGMVWFVRSGLFPVFGLFILVFAYQPGAVSRFLAHPILVLGGEISFSIYMVHQLVIRGGRHFDSWLSGMANWMVVGAIITCVFAISYLTWRFIETPFRLRFTRSQSRLFTEWRSALITPESRFSASVLLAMALIVTAMMSRGYWPASEKDELLAASGSPEELSGIDFQDAGISLVGFPKAVECGPDYCVTAVWKITEPAKAQSLKRVVLFFDATDRVLAGNRTSLTGAFLKGEKGTLIKDPIRVPRKRLSGRRTLASAQLTLLGPDHVGPFVPEAPAQMRVGRKLLISSAFGVESSNEDEE